MSLRRLTLTACVVDLQLQQVERDGVDELIGGRELALLAYLAARPGEVVSRGELLTEV